MRKILTENERKQAFIERAKKWRHNHPNYTPPPTTRASNLLYSYNREDEKYGRGKGDLTAQWIAENILTKSCVHCGESDWKKIGCNRLDNSKPHTMDNVEPCCRKCNAKLRGKDIKKERGKTIYQYNKDTMELIGVWASLSEAVKNIQGVYHLTINRCISGKQRTAGGYIFSNKPL